MILFFFFFHSTHYIMVCYHFLLYQCSLHTSVQDSPKKWDHFMSVSDFMNKRLKWYFLDCHHQFSNFYIIRRKNGTWIYCARLFFHHDSLKSPFFYVCIFFTGTEQKVWWKNLVFKNGTSIQLYRSNINYFYFIFFKYKKNKITTKFH